MITSTTKDHIAHIHLANGVNKLSREFTTELSHQLLKAERDPEVSVILLTTHERAFSVGAAIDELQSLKKEEVSDWLKPWETLSALTKPVVIALDGYVLGGGFEIAMMGDILLATDRVQFGQPEIKLGLIPGCGATLRLTQILGYHRAFELCATGMLISAQEAYKLGLLNHVVSSEKLILKAFEIAHSLASFPLSALQNLKKAMRMHFDKGHAHVESLHHEREAFLELLMSKNGQEGIRAFLEKRSPQFSR